MSLRSAAGLMLALGAAVGIAALLITPEPSSTLEAGALPINVVRPSAALQQEQPEPRAPVAPPALVGSEPPSPPAPAVELELFADAGALQPAPSDSGSPRAQTLAIEVDAGALLAQPTVELDAGPPLPPDERFIVRWDAPALCLDSNKSRAATLAGRDRLLQTFQPTWSGSWLIRHHPSIEEGTVRQISEALTRAHAISIGLLGARVASIRPPEVYVYENLDQLLDNACVNRSARGYYDGAIHLSGDWDSDKSAIHEYVHHALVSIGVKKPMWFHEGLAMFAADETWWKSSRLGLHEWILKSHLPFEALTDAFPHSSDAKFAVAVYYQSVLMVTFLRERSPDPDFRVFAEGLSSGRVSARKAFAHAAGLEGEALERAFTAFVKEQN